METGSEESGMLWQGTMEASGIVSVDTEELLELEETGTITSPGGTGSETELSGVIVMASAFAIYSHICISFSQQI